MATASTRRSGFGMVLMIVAGTLIVLAVFIMSQFFTGRAATHEIASADLSHRATIVAESATEECSFYALLAANDPGGLDAHARELFERLRTFETSSDAIPRIDGPTGHGYPYLFNVNYDVPQTKGFYGDAARVGDVTVSPFTIGILQQTTFPDNPQMGNESHGLLGFEGEVTVASPAGGRQARRAIQAAKDFRVLLLHPPYPFNRYTLFVKRPSMAVSDRFHSYFDHYETIDGLLPPFPVDGMASDERPVVTTEASVAPDAFVVQGLDTTLSVTTVDPGDLADQFAPMAAARFRKLSAEESSRYVDGNFYKQLQWEHLRNKASHVYDDFARFGHDVSSDGHLELSGMYYVEGAVTLEHSYSGRGIIVTTSTEGVRIRQCQRVGDDSRLVVIAARGDIRLHGNGTIDADLFAPQGTLRDAEGVTINGIVHIAYIQPGSTLGPRIVRPPDTTAIPWTEGSTLDPDYARKLGVFLTPGYAWRRIWSSRR